MGCCGTPSEASTEMHQRGPQSRHAPARIVGGQRGDFTRGRWQTLATYWVEGRFAGCHLRATSQPATSTSKNCSRVVEAAISASMLAAWFSYVNHRALKRPLYGRDRVFDQYDWRL